MSFTIASQLVTIQYGRSRLLTFQNGIWSIALNVLLNRFESSIVRVEACSLLTNLLQSMTNEDESSISLTSLQLMLQEQNFFTEIALLLASFYPYDTYNINSIATHQNHNITSNNLSLTLMHTITNDTIICSPLLICSICQLLYNMTILMPDDTLLNINNNGILRLLISYIKPTLLNSTNMQLQHENLIDMLKNISNYLMLCCLTENNFIIVLVKEENFLFDLIECLNIDGEKSMENFFWKILYY